MLRIVLRLWVITNFTEDIKQRHSSVYKMNRPRVQVFNCRAAWLRRGEGYIRIGGTTREPSAVNHRRTHHRKEEGGYEAGTKHYLTALQTWWSPHQGRSSANWWRANGETQWNFRGTVIKTKVAHSINLDNAQCAHCGNSPLWWLFCEIPFRQSPPFSVFVPLPKQRTLSVSCNLLFNTKSSAQGLSSGSF